MKFFFYVYIYIYIYTHTHTHTHINNVNNILFIKPSINLIKLLFTFVPK